MRSYIVRFKETRQPEAPAVAIPKPTARQIRTRTGCGQCKRRRVKCDEQQPSCQRCRVRGEKCSGPVVVPRWQTIVLAQDLSDGGLVQYWTTAVCGPMPLELHKPQLLPDAVLPLLDRSPALLHCIRGVAIAHRGFFSAEAVPASLRETSHALAGLRAELAIHDDLPRTLLAALGLSILSVWLDPSSQDSSSLLHLRGASSVLHLLLRVREEEANTLTNFMVGFYIYIDMIHSYAVPAAHPLPLSDSLATRLASSAGYIHPITGIATGLCLVVARVGRYLRSVVDLRRRDPSLERALHRSLRDWQPASSQPARRQHARIADAYRVLGQIMLHQARRHVADGVNKDEHDDDVPPPLDTLVAQALCIIAADDATASSADVASGVYTRGIILLAVGPEVSCGAGRVVITDAFTRLHKLTRVNHFLLAAQFVCDTCWPLRDRGVECTWLDLLVRAGLTCVLI